MPPPAEPRYAMRHDDLLVELGCEELPPKALPTLARAFHDELLAGLDEAGFEFDRQGSAYHYTPRRMAVRVAGLADRQPDRRQQRKGPAVTAAFDAEGQPTAAAHGFARSVGRTIEQLDRLVTAKGEWLQCTVEIPGQSLDELLFPLLEQALQRLPVPRPMRWSDHEASFVRPVHWLLVLHGEHTPAGRLFGCEAGRTTRGHRIHAPGPHPVARPEDYLAVLRAACVEADQEARREKIREGALRLGEAEEGATRITEDLLDEVNNLVEWPVAVVGHFEDRFLEVPHEALIASMESHQKFFPIMQDAGPTDDVERLSPAFVVIANLDSARPQAMIEGYERVVRPRLADADFFWRHDLKTPLPDRLPELERIVFQEKLGSIGDKTRRITYISKEIADFLAIPNEPLERAAQLSKCDLLSQMVSEFPELQGVMGGYYARAAGEPEAVAQAISEHYQPRSASDKLPASDLGRIVSLADRLDTLVGVFAIGLKPTGNRDPFALRRAALGLVRILLATGWPLRLDQLLVAGAEAFTQANGDRPPTLVDVPTATLDDVREFILERARSHFLSRGATARQMAAVLAAPLGTLGDLGARVEAVGRFMSRPESEGLISANKRIENILRKQEMSISSNIDPDLFTLSAEGRLFDEISKVESDTKDQLGQGDYDKLLQSLAALREPVDEYFDQVMVLDEDPRLRGNRLATLARLKSLFDRVADFSVTD